MSPYCQNHDNILKTALSTIPGMRGRRRTDRASSVQNTINLLGACIRIQQWLELAEGSGRLADKHISHKQPVPEYKLGIKVFFFVNLPVYRISCFRIIGLITPASPEQTTLVPMVASI